MTTPLPPRSGAMFSETKTIRETRWLIRTSLRISTTLAAPRITHPPPTSISSSPLLIEAEGITKFPLSSLDILLAEECPCLLSYGIPIDS